MSDPFVKIIAHSVSEEGIPIITAHFRYWRAIHSEVMTHRVFSRNARSSRAVPTDKMIAEIMNDPFIPRHWGKNQKGMQASEECNAVIHNTKDTIEGSYRYREDAWLAARNDAVYHAQAFADAGYHKQIVNRLVEPFMWIDTLITSTNWNNFFHLRDHKDAEPHFKDLAQLAKEEFAKSTPRTLKPFQWHLPYITDEEFVEYPQLDDPAVEELKLVSAARCARISYTPFDGNATYEKELERAKLLLGDPVHASPFEHQAMPDKKANGRWHNKDKHRNLCGWIQHRALIPGDTNWDVYRKQ